MWIDYDVKITTFDHGHVRGLKVIWVPSGEIIMEITSDNGSANMAFLSNNIGPAIMKRLIEEESKNRTKLP